jgi:L-rhamnose mutarotase
MYYKFCFFKRLRFALLMACLGFIACNQEKTKNIRDTTAPPAMVRRFGSVTGLRPEKVVYYEHLHSHVWPAVLKKIKECNIRNYSIYVQVIDGKYFLFSYFEYIGSDFNADMAKMAADTTTQRWWRETDPAQAPLPEAAAQKKIWQNMKEVFHVD